MKHFDYTEFRGEVKKQMVIQDIRDYKSLSEMIDRSSRSIAAFMCGSRNSPTMAMEIKKALNIEQNFGFESFVGVKKNAI